MGAHACPRNSNLRATAAEPNGLLLFIFCDCSCKCLFDVFSVAMLVISSSFPLQDVEKERFDAETEWDEWKRSFVTCSFIFWWGNCDEKSVYRFVWWSLTVKSGSRGCHVLAIYTYICIPRRYLYVRVFVGFFSQWKQCFTYFLKKCLFVVHPGGLHHVELNFYLSLCVSSFHLRIIKSASAQLSLRDGLQVHLVVISFLCLIG